MPNISIAIANQQSTLRIDRRRLVRLARSVLLQEHVAAAQISVAVLDDATIHAINRKFLSHDFPTDVISFLLDCTLAVDKPSLAPKISRPAARSNCRSAKAKSKTPGVPRWRFRRGRSKVIEGEIVMSAETAAGNAARFGNSPHDELALYLVHGLLHLCGYDDLTPKEKRLMRRREAEALARFDTELPRRRTIQRATQQ
jgi:probable rRNA maturation factor